MNLEVKDLSQNLSVYPGCIWDLCLGLFNAARWSFGVSAATFWDMSSGQLRQHEDIKRCWESHSCPSSLRQEHKGNLLLMNYFPPLWTRCLSRSGPESLLEQRWAHLPYAMKASQRTITKALAYTAYQNLDIPSVLCPEPNIISIKHLTTVPPELSKEHTLACGCCMGPLNLLFPKKIF